MLPSPTVDVQAPNGRRIVLRPAVDLRCLPGLSRAGLAAVAVLAAIFLVTSVNRLNHTDLWGHLNFGRWMVEHGRLPTADPFRPSAPAGPFVNIPWLAQVLGYACHQALGLEGLVLAHALLVTLTSAVLMLAVRARRVSLGWAAVAAIVAYGLATPIIGTIRPQLFGMLGFALVLYGISLLPTHRSVLLWVPLVLALWANLHGSFAMGLAVLGCQALGSSWPLIRKRLPERLFGEPSFAAPSPACERGAALSWLLLLLATLASCLNPYGPWLLASVAGFSGNQNLEGISEWRMMTPASLSGVLYFASLLIGLLLLGVSRGMSREEAALTPGPSPASGRGELSAVSELSWRVSATEVLLLACFGLVALTAIRMLVWWALVWPWIMAPHAAAVLTRWRGTDVAPDCGKSEESDAPAEAIQRLVFAVVLVGLVVWWSPPTRALCVGRGRPDAQVLSNDTPRELADWMQAHRISGRIFAPMDWADYLVWRNGPAIEPMVHSHVHLITPEVWQDFLAIDAGKPDWLSVADRHRLRYLVISRLRHEHLAQLIIASPRCRIVNQDRQAILTAILP
jgi:hypothetical protein